MTQLFLKKHFAEHDLDLSAYVYHAGSFHYNWHEDIELITVVCGEIEVCADGEVSRLSKDGVLLINANVGHATLSRTAGSAILLLRVHPRFFLRYCPDFGRTRLNVASCAADEEAPAFRLVRRFMARIMLSLFSRPGESELDLLCAFYALAGVIREAFPPEPSDVQSIAERAPGSNVREAMAYLEKHYRERISLKEVAALFNYNSSYMSQLFKENVGINFYDYLTRIRLRHATMALSASNSRVVDIAAEHGFTDLKSFNAKFREIFGRTPKDYRRSLTPEHQLMDKEFKSVFVDSSDEEAMRRLSDYASSSGHGCGLGRTPPSERRAEAAERLRRTGEMLARLADDVERGEI